MAKIHYAADGDVTAERFIRRRPAGDPRSAGGPRAGCRRAMTYRSAQATGSWSSVTKSASRSTR